MKQEYYLIFGLLTIIGFMTGCIKENPYGNMNATDLDTQLPPEANQTDLDPEENIVVADLDTQFQLKINQTASITGNNIQILFLNVTEDSRCPSSVLCIWAGRVTILVKVLRNGENLGNLALTAGVGQHEDSAIKYFDGYSIELTKVEPYPETSGRIDASEYEITLFVSMMP